MAAEVKISKDQYTAVNFIRNMKFDLKQNIMSCGLVSSLENISLTKTAIRLCHHGIHEELRQIVLARTGSRSLYFSDILKMYEEKVLKNASCLMLPTHFNEIMKEKIKIIGNELENYFLYKNFDFLRVQEDREKLFAYLENLCWTQEGKINKLKTIENIIENSNLSLKDKYILSCNNCLKEKIQDLFQKLPCSIITDILNDDWKNYENTDPFRLVKFWTFYFRGRNYGDRVKLLNDDSTSECLLKWAVNIKEDVAFQYIWKNFATETDKEHMINFIDLPYNGFCRPNNNCMLFLYNQRRHIELKDLLRVEIMNFVVITLDRISRYYKVVLVPAYVHEFIKTHNVWTSLKLLRFGRMINFLDSNAYVRFLEKFTYHFADDFKINFIAICNKVLRIFLDPEECIQPLKYLLKIGTFPNKMNFLLDENGMLFSVHILRKSLETFERFINDLFDSEEEILKFKILFFTSPEINILYCSYLIVNKGEFLEEMLTKFFSKDEKSRFKNELPYKNNTAILHQICILSNPNDLLTVIDKFISWCCEEDEDKIMKCKSRVFDLETPCCIKLREKFFRYIEYYISMSDWKMIEKYWKFIFFATKDDISTPSKKLDRIRKILHFESQKCFAEFLKIFITSCFEQHEIDELKKELIDSKMILTFVRDIFEKELLDNYSKAENLLDWCYSSDKDAINKFKTRYFIIFGTKIVLKLIQFPDYGVAVTNLFEWWKPSPESAKLFQNIVNIKIKRRRPRIKGFREICKLARSRINNCFRILTNISKQDHVMMEGNKQDHDIMEGSKEYHDIMEGSKEDHDIMERSKEDHVMM